MIQTGRQIGSYKYSPLLVLLSFPAHGSDCPDFARDWLDQGLHVSNPQVSNLPTLYNLKKRSCDQKKSVYVQVSICSSIIIWHRDEHLPFKSFLTFHTKASQKHIL